jgi:hypothetical protein
MITVRLLEVVMLALLCFVLGLLLTMCPSEATALWRAAP